jgi:hypothetical protein
MLMLPLLVWMIEIPSPEALTLKSPPAETEPLTPVGALTSSVCSLR